MPVAASALSLERPRSLKQALTMLAGDPALTPIAGCTDVYVGLHFGTMPERRFIDLWDLKELRGISVDGDVLRIGALTTYTEIIAVEDRPEARADARGGVARSRRRADPESRHARRQRRQRLAGRRHAAGAGRRERAHRPAQSRRRRERCAFDSYYTGYRKSVRQPDELIVAIEIPAHRRHAVVAQGRHPPRAGDLEDHDGAVRGRDVRIAFGSVAPTVVLARKTAAVLSGGGSIADAQAALRTEIAPIDDVRSTGEYRAKVAANLLAQFWKETA